MTIVAAALLLVLYWVLASLPTHAVPGHAPAPS